jgi:hypothetical protein
MEIHIINKIYPNKIGGVYKNNIYLQRKISINLNY